MRKDNLKQFLNVKNSTLTTADLYFYGDIVSDWWGAWDDTDQYPEAIRDFLKEHEGKSLNIYINSGGGSVFAGIAIYNMLKRHNGNKTVHIDGMAASIASVIALAGDEIIIPANAFMYIHKPWTDAYGCNADDLREQADMLDTIQEGIMSVYAEHIKPGVDIDKIETLVNAGTWLTAADTAELFNVTLTEPVLCAASITELTKMYKDIPEQLIKSASEKTDSDLRDKLKRILIRAI